MYNIPPPFFKRPGRIYSASQLGTETARSAPASGWVSRRGHGFILLAFVLFGMLWAATPAKAASGFPVRYDGALTILANGSVTAPQGVAVTLDGTLYVADTGGARIIKITASGATSTFSISGATLIRPVGLTVDSSGNLYIADAGTSPSGNNSQVVKVTPAGSGSVVNTQSFTLSGAQGVAVDTSGDIFVSDTNNNRIIEVASGGTDSVLTTSSGVALTSLSAPEGIAVDIFGNLYIVDTGNNRVVKVTTALAGSTLSTFGSLNAPVAVTVGNNGNVYIVDGSINQRVAVVTPQGDLYDLFFDEVNTELGVPSAIAVSANNTVYIADSSGNQVNAFQVDCAGFGHVTLGSSGTPQTLNFIVNGTATLTGVAIYTAGTQNLDFTIAANSGTPCTTGSNGISCTVNVQFTPTSAGLRRGALVLSYTDTTFGTGTLQVPLFGYGDAPVAALSPAVGSVLSVGSVSVNQPFETAYDGVGNVYVTSYQSSKLLKIPAGGGAGSTVTIPALPSPSTLNSPTGLAIDGAGNLFISDYNNSRLVEVTPAGTSKVIAVRGLSPGFGFPTSLAFTESGRLLVNDYGSGRIILLSPDIYDNGNNDGDGTVGFAVAYIYPLGSYILGSFNSTGVSVDTTGNVYFTDQNNNRIIKLDPLGNLSTLSLPSLTLNTPLGVNVDPNGNIYVVDSGNERIIQLTPGGVSVMKYSGPSLGQFVFGAAPDNSGNVLISDFSNNRLVELNVGQSALTFPSTNVGATSTAKTTTVTNIGDQALAFSANPTYTANFSLDVTDMNACTSSTSLAAGQFCDVPIIFSPQSVGSLSANIMVTNDTQNVAGSTQQIAVSGTAISPTTTTTTVTLSPPSPVYGQSVTFTATVSSGSGTPTGAVTFTDQTTATTLASNVSLSSGVATVTRSTLGAGSHIIKAVYTPTASFIASNGTVTATINKAGTSTALTLSSGVLTAVVTAIPPGAGTPTGTVQFLNGSVVIGDVPLTGGTATLAGAPSAFTATAVYSGDANFNSSTSASVTQTTSSVSLSSSANPSALGQAVTFTAVVTTNPASGGPTTGTVQFSDGATLLGSVSVSGSQAVFTTSALTGGAHGIVARYSGNGAYPPSQASLGQIVGTPLTIAVSAAPTIPVFGQAVVLTVSVRATAPPGFAAPTGQVTWLEGGTPFTPGTVLGKASLVSGTASLSLNTLAAGTHTITAQYSGDATWNGATSTLTLTVSLASSSSTISLALVSGQLTLTANVAAVAPGIGTPTGSVQFVDTLKHTVIATANLSGGTGSATIAAGAAAGVDGRPIAAVYSGDAEFNGSTSAPLPAMLNAASYTSASFADDEIASLFDIPGLNGDITATSPLTTSLGGATVTITDSTGATRQALLYGVYASSGQINFLVPGDAAAGLAIVTIALPGGGAITTVVNIIGTSPGIFTVNSTGQGVYAGQVLYVHQDGSQTLANSTGPVSLAAGNHVFLVLYGTGLRHASSVAATVNGASVPVIYFGAQGGSQTGPDGLDQVNVGPLPASLAGAGVVQLVISADGQAANTVTFSVQ